MPFVNVQTHRQSHRNNDFFEHIVSGNTKCADLIGPKQLGSCLALTHTTYFLISFLTAHLIYQSWDLHSRAPFTNRKCSRISYDVHQITGMIRVPFQDNWHSWRKVSVTRVHGAARNPEVKGTACLDHSHERHGLGGPNLENESP